MTNFLGRSAAALLLTIILTPRSGVQAQCAKKTIFSDPGIFHIPNNNHEVKRFTWDPPDGCYNKIYVDLDVTNTGWNKTDPSATHNIFWLVRDGNPDMIGYINVQGPGKNKVFNRSGIGVTHGFKTKVTKNFQMSLNKKYHFRYEYDMTTKKIVVRISEGGNIVATLNDTTNVNALVFKNKQRLIMDLGFATTAYLGELPSNGWEYQDVKIEMFPCTNNSVPKIGKLTIQDATCDGCKDATATPNITGGALPYSYLWTDPSKQNGKTATGLRNGVYELTVSDANGCGDQKTVVVGQSGSNIQKKAPVKIHPADPNRLRWKAKTIWPSGVYPALGALTVRPPSEYQTYYKLYFDELKASNLNICRNVLTMGQYIENPNPNAANSEGLVPFLRTGPGLANDGLPKYDLTKYDTTFFNYWKDVLSYAEAKGIIVILSIFDGWHLRQWDKNNCGGNSTGSTTTWCPSYDFYNGANNINGANAATVEKWHDVNHSTWVWQKAFIRKVVNELGHFSNIIWESANENWESPAWDLAVNEYVTNYELSKGITPHPTMPGLIPGHSVTPGGGGPGNYVFSANNIPKLHNDLVSKHKEGKPLFVDNDAGQGIISPIAARRHASWACMTAGAHLNLFQFYIREVNELLANDARQGMKFLGLARKFLDTLNIDLAGMVPSDHLVTNGAWCYGKTNDEYVIYHQTGGSFTVDSLPATFTATWFNPRTGDLKAAGKGPNFTTPTVTDWALHIVSDVLNNTSSVMVEPINVFPNPSGSGVFNISVKNEELVIEVYDLFGRHLIKGENLVSIDLSGQSKGVYLLKGILGDKVYVKRLVIN